MHYSKVGPSVEPTSGTGDFSTAQSPRLQTTSPSAAASGSHFWGETLIDTCYFVNNSVLVQAPAVCIIFLIFKQAVEGENPLLEDDF